MKEFDESKGKTLRSSEWTKEDGLWRKRYRHEENSWITERNLEASDLIATFYKTNLNAPKHISTLAFGRWRQLV
jgi:hypothetical protein